MALERLYGPNTRWIVIEPEAIKDFANPTSDELNAAIANGLGANITCAVNQDGSTFDLGDSETDDSLTFCQVAGAVNPTSYNPEITIEVETSRDRTEGNTANTAHEARTAARVSGGAAAEVGGASGRWVLMRGLRSVVPCTARGLWPDPHAESTSLAQSRPNGKSLRGNPGKEGATARAGSSPR